MGGNFPLSASFVVKMIVMLDNLESVTNSNLQIMVIPIPINSGVFLLT